MQDAWLKNVIWRLAPELTADADIEANGVVFPVSLKYPHAFPNCPPSVFPRGVKRRWSFHQYGKGGELCLEWGADNWHPDITGADMLASAYKLLGLENPSPESEEEPEIPSRDAPTLSQSLRWETDRFVATPALVSQLQALPLYQVTKVSVSLNNVRTSLAVVAEMQEDGHPPWHDASVPAFALDGLKYDSAAIRLPDQANALPLTSDAATLYAALNACGVDMSSWPEADRSFRFLLLCIGEKPPTLIWLPRDSSGSLTLFSTICIEPGSGDRLPLEYQNLRNKSVCFIGCGSLGSKVATSLARAGVGRFELIDDDIFFPENLVRNELDWRDMGSHKADALVRKIPLVNPAARATRYKIRLNGQEASNQIAEALQAAATCTLIIDATGAPAVFNLAAALAHRDNKPMIWAEILAGGIGGMIARFRPGMTPNPYIMRGIINQWCADRDAPWTGSDAGYDTETEGRILTADDADVSAIAAHAARLALDTLLERDPPDYAHAAYFIGLKPDWIFGGPFDTYPVEIGPPHETAGSVPALSADRQQENVGFLTDLLERFGRENPSSG